MSIETLKREIENMEYHVQQGNVRDKDYHCKTANEVKRFLDCERRLLVAIAQHLIEQHEMCHREEQPKLYTQEEYDKINKESYEIGFNTALSMIEKTMKSLRP